jgi:D-threonate/D-erythronate kinase
VLKKARIQGLQEPEAEGDINRSVLGGVRRNKPALCLTRGRTRETPRMTVFAAASYRSLWTGVTRQGDDAPNILNESRLHSGFICRRIPESCSEERFTLTPKCLIIADDLTGGADAGAQFAGKGLNTLLILTQESRIDFSRYADREVLVVSTHTRGVSPEEASRRIALLLNDYPKNLFSIVYKKIDSTLRGNIGCETDAILKTTGLSIGFLTPAFPEEDRIVVGGIHLVRGRPLSLTEMSSDVVSPVKESYVKDLVEKQSTCRIASIDLIRVASGGRVLKKAIGDALQQGVQILIFDAATRRDLEYIAGAAFERDEKLLFIGSAGLAEEVAKKLASGRRSFRSLKQKTLKKVRHILIISGSASSISHEQLNYVEQKMPIHSFQLDQSFLGDDKNHRLAIEDGCIERVNQAFIEGTVILRTTWEKMVSVDSEDLPVPSRITESLGRIAASVLERSHLDVQDLSLVLFGGDTVLSILDRLKTEGVEIEGEILKGIMVGRLIGGRWHGLRIVTKAGAFGKKKTLEKILGILGGSDRT